MRLDGHVPFRPARIEKLPHWNELLLVNRERAEKAASSCGPQPASSLRVNFGLVSSAALGDSIAMADLRTSIQALGVGTLRDGRVFGADDGGLDISFAELVEDS